MQKILFILTLSYLLVACKPSQSQPEENKESVFFIPNLEFHNYRIEYLVSYAPIQINLLNSPDDPDSWINDLRSQKISFHSTHITETTSANIDEYIDSSVTKFEWNLRTGKFHPYCPKGNRLKAVDTIQRQNASGFFLKSSWYRQDPELVALEELLPNAQSATIYVLLYLSTQDTQNQYHRTYLRSLTFSLSE